jgi:hypothetical protein
LLCFRASVGKEDNKEWEDRPCMIPDLIQGA